MMVGGRQKKAERIRSNYVSFSPFSSSPSFACQSWMLPGGLNLSPPLCQASYEALINMRKLGDKMGE